MEDGEQEASEEEKILTAVDHLIGDIHASLPADTLLIVATFQGDTANARLIYVRPLIGPLCDRLLDIEVVVSSTNKFMA